MHLSKKYKSHVKVYGMLILCGWFIWIQSVEAAQTVFPVATEKGDPFGIEASLLKGNVVKNQVRDSVEKGGSAGRTTSRKEMKNPECYDDLTPSERNMLYKVVSMECDTGYEGSLAVISCMMNRTQSAKYPDDLMEVVREDSQFTAYYDKETGTYPYVDRKPSAECIAAVDDALNKGNRNIPSYILYFRSSEYNYLNGYERYGQIGDNTYFYLSEDKQ